jgi:hypothetical protein
VQPTTTPWAMTPITAEGSAVPHAKSPLLIGGRRNRQQGGRHRVRLTWYALRVRRVCAVRAVAAWTSTIRNPFRNQCVQTLLKVRATSFAQF